MSNQTTYGLIGHPLGHTMSPFIHACLFERIGISADYILRDIPPEQLAEQLDALCEQVRGFNVTIPHKQAVIPHMIRLEGRAALYRSVNTVLVTPEGPVGYNTDAYGFLRALKEAAIPLKGRVALLGSGGVSRTFACEAALAGCRIVNAVRDADREAAGELQAYVRQLVPTVEYSVTSTSELEGTFDLLLNGTPVGMYPQTDASPVSAGVVSRCAAVFDAVYNPRETRLLQMARAAGAATLGGMSMLVGQAAVAQSIWLGQEHTAADIQTVIEQATEEMERMFHG